MKILMILTDYPRVAAQLPIELPGKSLGAVVDPENALVRTRLAGTASLAIPHNRSTVNFQIIASQIRHSTIKHPTTTTSLTLRYLQRDRQNGRRQTSIRESSASNSEFRNDYLDVGILTKICAILQRRRNPYVNPTQTIEAPHKRRQFIAIHPETLAD